MERAKRCRLCRHLYALPRFKKVPQTTVVCPGLINKRDSASLSSMQLHCRALMSTTQTKRDESKKAVEALILYQSQANPSSTFLGGRYVIST